MVEPWPELLRPSRSIGGTSCSVHVDVVPGLPLGDSDAVSVVVPASLARLVSLVVDGVVSVARSSPGPVAGRAP